jgi:hypothetical protein
MRDKIKEKGGRNEVGISLQKEVESGKGTYALSTMFSLC